QLRLMLAAAARPALEVAPASPRRQGVREVLPSWFRFRWWKIGVATGLLAALTGAALLIAAARSSAGDTPIHHGPAPPHRSSQPPPAQRARYVRAPNARRLPQLPAAVRAALPLAFQVASRGPANRRSLSVPGLAFPRQRVWGARAGCTGAVTRDNAACWSVERWALSVKTRISTPNAARLTPRIVSQLRMLFRGGRHQEARLPAAERGLGSAVRRFAGWGRAACGLRRSAGTAQSANASAKAGIEPFQGIANHVPAG